MKCPASLNALDTNDIIWTGGDLNLPDIDWKAIQIVGHQYPNLTNQTFLSKITDMALHQVNDKPTRGNATLDILCTSRPNLVTKNAVIPGLSDHDIVLVDSRIKANKTKPIARNISVWKQADYEAIRSETAAFSEHFASNPPDTAEEQCKQSAATCTQWWRNIYMYQQKHAPQNITNRGLIPSSRNCPDVNNVPGERPTGLKTPKTGDGGGGVYIRYNDGTAQITIATGKYSTNFKAEAEALKKAATEIRNNLPRTKPNVVIFTNALSVLSKLPNPRQQDLSEVETALVDLAAQTNLILQWIPAHCGVQGNEQADRLAREGGQLEEEDRYTTYTDKKTIIKTLSKTKWKQQHPNYNQSDSLHTLNNPEQIILFRLSTGHKRLNAHMYNKFKVGESEMCPCNTDIMTAEYLLHHCPLHDAARAGHMAGTDVSEGQALWHPGGAEEDSRLREGNTHLHLAYDDDDEEEYGDL